MLASVFPEMNQRSSSTTPRQKTRFVVSSGKSLPAGAGAVSSRDGGERSGGAESIEGR